jgi:hypothetical protein
MHAPRGRSSARARALTFLAGALFLAACAGSNLFSVTASAGTGGPEVTITAPQENLTIAQGASVQVLADVNAPNGVGAADVRGIFVEDQAPAFVARTLTFQNPSFVSLEETLDAVDGQGTGPVWIIVKATDGLGTAAADTVQITIS